MCFYTTNIMTFYRFSAIVISKSGWKQLERNDDDEHSGDYGIKEV